MPEHVWLIPGLTYPKAKSAVLALQDNVALIAVLEALDPPQLEGANRRQLICVANTHIHANPELNDVKLWQVSNHAIGWKSQK